MTDLSKDLRYALRSWRKSPGFTLTVLLTVLLSVGATTAIFSVINGVLLKPLPYPDPDRVVILWSSNPGVGLPMFSVPPHDFVDLQEQSRSFEALGARIAANFNLTGDGGEPERIHGERITEGYFPALGLTPLHGRLINREDQASGGAHVAVLNRGLWQRRFGGDPGLVGRTILVDGEAYVVVGIADEHLREAQVEIWVPLGLDLAQEQRGVHRLSPVARLKPGVSLEQAQAELDTIAGRLARQYPDTNAGWGLGIARMHDFIVRDVRPRLLILLAAVVAVLLIACANLMNLFLARFATRERELAIRSVLGAGRARVTRQLLTEVLLMTVAGSALGVAVAAWGTHALLALNTSAVPRPGEVGIDGRVLLFALSVALLTGLAAGVWPALRSARSELVEPLKEGARTMAGGVRGKLIRNALVLTEVVAALILLIAAGLLIKGFARLNDLDPGFRADHGLTARIALSPTRYGEAAQQIAAWDALLERARALPGVQAAGLVSQMPLVDRRLFKGGAYLKGEMPASENEIPVINVRTVSPGTFRALGIPLLAGRGALPADGAASAKVVMINHALADRLWPGVPAAAVLGRQIIYGTGPSEPQEATVVGVAGDLVGRTPDDLGSLEVDVPYPQAPLTELLSEGLLILRTTGEPEPLAGPLRNAVSSYDRELPVADVQTLQTIVDVALSPARFATILIAVFAGLALVLASVGVYGVISYSVSQRTHEIGIRMAMGADRGAVLRMVLAQSLALTLAGVVLGLACAAGLTRFLAGQLFGVSATDPAIFAAVAVLLILVALVASWLPARRATGVDPLTAMR
ncbi:MAG TPA: ABC transporter permease [Thermoanaerobaculia bacterium]|nr:ABC transporter permease [Thermoanaerobaculia bacterium]